MYESALKFALAARLLYELVFCELSTFERFGVTWLFLICAVLMSLDLIQSFLSDSKPKITRTWDSYSQSVVLSTYRDDTLHGEQLTFSHSTNSKTAHRHYKYGEMVRELLYDSNGKIKIECKFNRFGDLVLLNKYREGLLYRSKSYYVQEKRKGFHGLMDCRPGSFLSIHYTYDNPDQTRQVVKKIFHKIDERGKSHDYFLHYVDENGKVQPNRPSLQIIKGHYNIFECRILDSGEYRLQTYKGGLPQTNVVKYDHPLVKKYRFLEKLDPNLDVKE
jgi:hypothetical protein